MKEIYKNIIQFLTTFNTEDFWDQKAFKGAALGVFAAAGVLLLISAILTFANNADPWVILFYLGRVLFYILLTFVLNWFVKLVASTPRIYRLAVIITFLVFISITYNKGVSLLLVAIFSLTGASFYVLIKSDFKTLPVFRKLLILLGLIVGLGGCLATLFIYAKTGLKMDGQPNAALISIANTEQINMDSPASKGPYAVKQMTYGSGSDRHRPEYGSKVDEQTKVVDGHAFIDNWRGISGWWRERYWGFDAGELPINGRVWYPEGAGPFPLALIVHGDHEMQDYSDAGYDYLGELLASRGIILASVDQNFLNISWSDFRGRLVEENDARAWLLLEHLKVWHDWNKTKGHLFSNKIDSTKIALMGHSRGGGSIAHAALFNRLKHYPDDARIKFDYNFNINSLVAIAPVDGQYEPGGSRTPLQNINYFVLHGSQDGEVTSYVGSKQYERVTFSDTTYNFKAGVYIRGANHGQFNSSWGEKDALTSFKGMLNLEQLLPEKEQQEIAKVYISAFLETTLKDKAEFLPLFKDYRTGIEWLPETIYLNQFEDSYTTILCSFDEDLDVASTTENAGQISANGFSQWREGEIKLKQQKKGSRGLYLGWTDKLGKSTQENPDAEVEFIPTYSIAFPEAIAQADSTSVFVFSMAEMARSSEPINFSIALEDVSGRRLEYLLSDFSLLQNGIQTAIWKTDLLRGRTETEKVFQLFSFPIKEKITTNPGFDPKSIVRIHFMFNKSKEGAVLIDNIGFMNDLQMSPH